MPRKAKTRWDGYQARIAGKDTQVKDLSKEQLLDELCKAIDFLEAIDDRLHALTGVTNDWRRGHPAPESEEETN